MKPFYYYLSLLSFSLLLVNCTTKEGQDVLHSDFEGYIYYGTGSVLYRINTSDETEEQLMNNATQPDVMANGNIVAIEGASTGRIIITDITGANRSTLVQWANDQSTPHLLALHAPRISYDQQYVAYDGDVYRHITYVVDAVTGDLVLTIGDFDNKNEQFYAPCWAPDGSLIVQGGPTVNNGIYKINPEFTTITRIDPNLSNVSAPSVSPDGNKIAFVRDSELWTMGINGNNPTQIITNLFQLSVPTWSPDSKYIALNSAQTIHIIDPITGTDTKFEQDNPGYPGEGLQLCWR